MQMIPTAFNYFCIGNLVCIAANLGLMTVYQKLIRYSSDAIQFEECGWMRSSSFVVVKDFQIRIVVTFLRYVPARTELCEQNE